MRRRQFMTGFGAATLWPIALRAQQRERMKRIGILMGVSDDAEGKARLATFLKTLQEAGWTNNQSVLIETRWAATDMHCGAGYRRPEHGELRTHRGIETVTLVLDGALEHFDSAGNIRACARCLQPN